MSATAHSTEPNKIPAPGLPLQNIMMNFNDQRQHITLAFQDYDTTTWLSIRDKTKRLEAGTCICLTPNVIPTCVSECYDPFGIELDPVYKHHRRRLVTPLGCSYLKELPRNCLSPDRRIVFLKPLKCRVKPRLRGMFYGCR